MRNKKLTTLTANKRKRNAKIIIDPYDSRMPGMLYNPTRFACSICDILPRYRERCYGDVDVCGYPDCEHKINYNPKTIYYTIDELIEHLNTHNIILSNSIIQILSVF